MATVLITGASSGIGAQLAKDYAAKGWKVYACGREPTRLEPLQQFGAVTCLRFDVTDPQQCAASLGGITDIDLAILNAGTCEYIDCDDWQADKFGQVIRANLDSVNYCLAALLPNLKTGSALAVVDSLARLLPFTRSQAYGASKAAVHYLTQTLAVDLEPKGIRVVAVSPGFVKTPLTDRNQFAMPTLLSVEEASRRISQGIASNKAVVAFPKRLYWTLTLLSWLPLRWQYKLCRRMKGE
ncbi:SDR family NAD(P)-dependent oxidoreductase [Ferrimonas senticii]|uniref:SDR family NAD(P)-dependent oxidoreductase n=1 Tax=Ferrimonas senticii TaxID=394566 RepID=UPI0004268CDF|nr:SDR family NAD(P)-dependent oxidoreductase [Ferrimonas senticii]